MKAFKDFKRYFFRGLAALLPTIVTIWIFVQCYIFVRDAIGAHISRGLVRLMESAVAWSAGAAPSEEAIQKLEEFWVHGPGQVAGFLLALILVCFVGAILASVVGRTLWRYFEGVVMKTPLLGRVYPYIKQVTDLFLSEKRLSFLKVVAVEYPRKDSWSVAFVTGTGLKEVSSGSKKEFLTIFVPTSPTPFTGYVIMTPRDETIELDMTVEEALRFTVSGGVIVPGSQSLEGDMPQGSVEIKPA